MTPTTQRRLIMFGGGVVAGCVGAWTAGVMGAVVGTFLGVYAGSGRA